MNRFKKILFIFLATAGTVNACHAQTTNGDTTYYSIERWKLKGLIKVAAKAKQCDNLVISQAKLISDAQHHEIAADSINRIQMARIEEFEKHVLDQDSVSVDLKKLIVIEKKKARPWKIGAITLGFIEVLRIVTTGKL